MKTLAELNSKWYWRLVKVIWVFLIIVASSFVIIWAWIYFYESSQQYHPSNISKASLKITEYEENHSDIKKINDQYLRIKEISSNLIENIEVKDEDGLVFRSYDQVTRQKLKKHLKEINTIFGTWDSISSIYLLRSLWYNIEWVNFSDTEKNRYISPNDATFDKYLNWLEITINDTYGMFDEAHLPDLIEELNKLIKESKSDLSNIKKWISYRFYFYNNKDKSDELNELLWSRDHISILWWIKIISYEIWTIAMTILVIYGITYILRWILYYIILWKFNPKN